MKKLFLALLLVNVAHANINDDIDITPMLLPYAAANPVQPLPKVIAPIEYDLPESKWSKPNTYQAAGKCQTPMNLFEHCKSARLLKFEALAAAKRKKLKDEHRNSPKVYRSRTNIRASNPILLYAYS